MRVALPEPALADVGRRLSVLRAAQEQPGATAVVEADGRAHRYADLVPKVRWAMHRLRELGIDPRDRDARVAVIARPTLPTIVALHATFELGIAAVPIHARLREGERHALLRQVGSPVVIEAGAEGMGTHEHTAAPHRSGNPDDGDPLAIVHTSGSTGRPKGVVLSRRAVVAAADASAWRLGWRDDDRWLLCMPPAHVGGLSILIRTLVARRAVVLAPESSFDADAIAGIMRRDRVSIASLVPTMLARMLDVQPAWAPPSALRAVLLGGAPAAPALVARAVGRGVPVLTTYGLSETFGQVTTQDPSAGEHGEPGAGRPLPTLGVRIAREGEIQVRSPSCMRGWLGDGPDPWTDDGWLRTGDAGAFDGQGRLHVHGRLDDRIITGGENVDPLEVERVLQELPEVASACVFGVPDETWGTVVAAAVVLQKGEAGSIDGSRLWAHLAHALAPYKRPRQWTTLDALVINHTGKVDRGGTAAKAEPRLVSLPPIDPNARSE